MSMKYLKHLLGTPHIICSTQRYVNALTADLCTFSIKISTIVSTVFSAATTSIPSKQRKILKGHSIDYQTF